MQRLPPATFPCRVRRGAGAAEGRGISGPAFWPFHDARHAALTHLALTPGASELVLMATAGHRSVATTRKYLHLAGRAFPEAAAGLSDRLLGDGDFVPRLYPSGVISADLSPSKTASETA